MRLLSTLKTSCPSTSRQFFQMAVTLPPPERWRPGKRKQGLSEEASQKVTSNVDQPLLRDSQIVYCYQKDQSMINMLVQKGVVPLVVDKSIIAGRLALFQANIGPNCQRTNGS